MAKKPTGKPAAGGRGGAAPEPFDNGQKMVGRPGEATQFKPGWPGGPGRPLGARNRLSEDFLSDMADAWQRDGRAAISQMIKNDPVAFVKCIASLLPREDKLDATIKLDMDELTDEELAGLIKSYRALIRNLTQAPGGSGQPH